MIEVSCFDKAFKRLSDLISCSVLKGHDYAKFTKQKFKGTLNLAHSDITKTDKHSTEKVVAVLENDVGSS